MIKTFDAHLRQVAGVEVEGVVDCDADPRFNLDALLAIVEAVAQTHEVSAKQVIQDLWVLAHGEKK